MKPNMKRPPLKVSTIPSHHIQIREGERKAIVCPDCTEWHPIRRSMVWPHRLERTERGENARRCPGSARSVEIDVDLAEWGRKITEADATVTGRRSNRVNRKPRTLTPPPVTRLATTPKPPAPRLTSVLERAQHATATHRDACRACREGHRCATGRELEVWHAETAATVRLLVEQQERAERQTDGRLARERVAGWRKTAPQTRRVDRRRMERPKGAAPVDGPDVPLVPLHF